MRACSVDVGYFRPDGDGNQAPGSVEATPLSEPSRFSAAGHRELTRMNAKGRRAIAGCPEADPLAIPCSLDPLIPSSAQIRVWRGAGGLVGEARTARGSRSCCVLKTSCALRPRFDPPCRCRSYPPWPGTHKRRAVGSAVQISQIRVGKATSLWISDPVRPRFEPCVPVSTRVTKQRRRRGPAAGPGSLATGARRSPAVSGPPASRRTPAPANGDAIPAAPGVFRHGLRRR
jgi:hypothetical protein